jgi:hypothetical protein
LNRNHFAGRRASGRPRVCDTTARGRRTQGAKALFRRLAAQLKSCPDTAPLILVVSLISCIVNKRFRR